VAVAYGRFEVGRLVLRRQFQRGGLLSRVWVGRVAADDRAGLWLWIASGSAYRNIAAADGRDFRQVPFDEWGRTDKVLRELTWRGDMLVFHPTGQAHSVWFFFRPDGSFRAWYINLEQPSARWDDGDLAGVDTVDFDLDIVVAPDRTWQWKDEDEFAHHLAHPDVYWVADEHAVWAEGTRVLQSVEAGVFPFDGTGTDFRPDPSWSLPTGLRPGWDRARAGR
jgi:hypothetical protein